MCLSVCLSAYVSFCLSMCLLVFLHLYPTLYHCVDLFVSLFVCLSVLVHASFVNDLQLPHLTAEVSKVAVAAAARSASFSVRSTASPAPPLVSFFLLCVSRGPEKVWCQKHHVYASAASEAVCGRRDFVPASSASDAIASLKSDRWSAFEHRLRQAKPTENNSLTLSFWTRKYFFVGFESWKLFSAKGWEFWSFWLWF